jgi:hypothetical protein
MAQTARATTVPSVVGFRVGSTRRGWRGDSSAEVLGRYDGQGCEIVASKSGFGKLSILCLLPDSRYCHITALIPRGQNESTDDAPLEVELRFSGGHAQLRLDGCPMQPLSDEGGRLWSRHEPARDADVETFVIGMIVFGSVVGALVGMLTLSAVS